MSLFNFFFLDSLFFLIINFLWFLFLHSKVLSILNSKCNFPFWSFQFFTENILVKYSLDVLKKYEIIILRSDWQGFKSNLFLSLWKTWKFFLSFFLSFFVLLLLELLLLLFCFFLASDIFVIKALYFYVENQTIAYFMFLYFLSFFVLFPLPLSYCWNQEHYYLHGIDLQLFFLFFFFFLSFRSSVILCSFLCFFLSFSHFFLPFLFVCLFFVFTQESVEFGIVWAQDTTPDEGGVPVNYHLC